MCYWPVANFCELSQQEWRGSGREGASRRPWAQTLPVDVRQRPSDQFPNCWVNSEFRCVIAWRDGIQFSGAGLGPHKGGPRTANKKSDCNLCLECKPINLRTLVLLTVRLSAFSKWKTGIGVPLPLRWYSLSGNKEQLKRKQAKSKSSLPKN